jgi:threonine/homoserine/homoserine lactone efflux protein
MEFLLIATAHFLALLSPGPDFFLILQASLRLPVRYGIAICGGIAAANGTYLLGSVLGLEILKELSWLMVVLKYLGAGYLVFIGIMLLKNSAQSPEKNHHDSLLLSRNIFRQFMIGYMSAILNPKNVIFYLSLFTVMVSEQTQVEIRLLYALWMTSVVFVWDSLIVIVIGRDHCRHWLGQGTFYLEKFAGVMLTVFGLILPFS